MHQTGLVFLCNPNNVPQKQFWVLPVNLISLWDHAPYRELPQPSHWAPSTDFKPHGARANYEHIRIDSRSSSKIRLLMRGVTKIPIHSPNEVGKTISCMAGAEFLFTLNHSKLYQRWRTLACSSCHSCQVQVTLVVIARQLQTNKKNPQVGQESPREAAHPLVLCPCWC